MSDQPDEIPRNGEDQAKAEAIYADLVDLYPDNEAYLQHYAELLLADKKTTTATSVLRRLHDLLARRSPDKAANLARKYPQVGRIDHNPDEEDLRELGESLKKAFGMLWIRMHQKQLVEGQHLYRRGEQGKTVSLILKGQLAVYLQMESGKNIILDILSEGDIVGEDIFLSPGEHASDVVANQATTYVELPRKQLLTWLLDHPDIERLLEHKANLRHMTRLLSSTPLLQQVPLKMRLYMAEKSRLIRYRAGSIIHRAGDTLDYVDMLVHGDAHLAVRTQTEGDRLTPLAAIEVGQLIGDTSAVRNATCPADIQAGSDVLMAHVPLSAFTNVVEAYPPLREKLLKHAEKQRRKIMEQVLALGKKHKE